MNGLNIWPFYKIDERLVCMGQYWGLNKSKAEILYKYSGKYNKNIEIGTDSGDNLKSEIIRMD